MAKILIRNVRMVEPRQKLDLVGELLLADGKIEKIGSNLSAGGAEQIEAKGLTLIPGLVDLHTHFREPGFEHKETIASGSQAALHGGYVASVAMPNTQPPSDSESIVASILRQAEKVGFPIFPCGTLSKGRAGKEISEMADLKRAGCVAVSDDGNYVSSALLMRRACEYASMLDLLVMSHALDEELSRNGVMNEGRTSTMLGLKGIPNEAEEIAVARDLLIARLTRARLHLAHLSTGEAVDLVRRAKEEGLSVTAEVTPHHLALTDEVLADYDTHFKMNPPLRTRKDIEALRRGLKEGIIDCIATDHAPHQEEEKELDFGEAPFGVIGLETAFAVILTELYHTGFLSLPEVIEKMAMAPLRILKLPPMNEVREGNLANFTLVDLDREWMVRKEDFFSKSKNSCFLGRTLKGKVVATVCQGKEYRF